MKQFLDRFSTFYGTRNRHLIFMSTVVGTAPSYVDIIMDSFYFDILWCEDTSTEE